MNNTYIAGMGHFKNYVRDGVIENMLEAFWQRDYSLAVQKLKMEAIAALKKITGQDLSALESSICKFLSQSLPIDTWQAMALSY